MPETAAPADLMPPPISLPLFWPVAMVAGIEKSKADLALRNLKFVEEEIKIHDDLPAASSRRRTTGAPGPANHDAARLRYARAVFRHWSTRPIAGHTAMIADYAKGQSLVETLLANGIGHVALTDWKSATADMKDLEIDNYLADIVVAIDDLGGRVNLVGLCQGGWTAAMVAARFPEKVNSLVLAGAPIDTDAGDGPIKAMVHKSPISFYQELVELGGG